MLEKISFMPRVIIGNEVKNNECKKNQEIALYINIPFCKSKCGFCGINTECNFDDYKSYINALEINLRKNLENIGDKYISCIHIGGGTPTILPDNDLISFLDMISRRIPNYNMIEKVIEANPESLSKEKIDIISDNKNMTLSIGIQSLDEKILNACRRKCDITKTLELIEYAKKAKINGLGIDLIYGLPYSTIHDVLKSLDMLIKMDVDYFSIYPFWKEEKSSIGLKWNKYENKISNKCDLEEIYNKIVLLLTNSNFIQKSCHHFEKKDINSLFKYNTCQLNGKEWIGVGASAVSYYDGILCENTCNAKKFIEAINEKSYSYEYIKKLTLSDIVLEEIFFKVRRYQGVNIKEEYGSIIWNGIKGKFDCWENKGLLLCNNNSFVLTPKGVLELGNMEKELRDILV